MTKQPEPPHEDETPRATRRDYAKLLLGFAATVGVLVFLALKHPTDYGVIPSCPFHAGTGFLCPGCGSMRATHYLVTGHPLTSLRYNLLILPVLPLLAFSAIRWFCSVFLRRDIPFPHQIGVYWTVTVVFIVFFIARNIPLECLDVLRPPIRPPTMMWLPANFFHWK